jgi:protocatechuate 3,4-dioxygenase beta subunit
MERRRIAASSFGFAMAIAAAAGFAWLADDFGGTPSLPALRSDSRGTTHDESVAPASVSSGIERAHVEIKPMRVAFAPTPPESPPGPSEVVVGYGRIVDAAGRPVAHGRMARLVLETFPRGVFDRASEVILGGRIVPWRMRVNVDRERLRITQCVDAPTFVVEGIPLLLAREPLDRPAAVFDSAGRFRLVGAAPHSMLAVVVAVTKDGAFGTSEPFDFVNPTIRDDLVVRLLDLPSVVVTVRRSRDSQPVANCNVLAAYGGASFDAITDTAGSATFRGLGSGRFTFRAKLAGDDFVPSEALRTLDGSTARIAMELSDAIRVSGTLLSIDGEPLSHARVSLWDAEDREVAATTSDAKGVLRPFLLPKGLHRMRVDVVEGIPFMDRAMADLAKEDRIVAFEVVPSPRGGMDTAFATRIPCAGAIDVDLVLPESLGPVVAASLLRYDVRDGTLHEARYPTQRGSRFTAPLLAPGRYGFLIQPALGPRVLSETFFVASKQRVMLSPAIETQTLDVEVIDAASGLPLAGAAAEIDWRSDLRERFGTTTPLQPLVDLGTYPRAVTGADGRLRLAGLQPRLHVMRLAADGHLDQEIEFDRHPRGVPLRIEMLLSR